MNSFKITIEGQQFRKAYFVYVIRITTQDNINFFYIGQTGDRNYLTARPAFRRLAGHFSDIGSSTENQVYRQIAVKVLKIEDVVKKEKFNESTKKRVGDFLETCKIEMFVYQIADFEDNSDKDLHTKNRKQTELIENELINCVQKKVSADKVFNKKFSVITTTELQPETIKILEELDLN